MATQAAVSFGAALLGLAAYNASTEPPLLVSAKENSSTVEAGESFMGFESSGTFGAGGNRRSKPAAPVIFDPQMMALDA